MQWKVSDMWMCKTELRETPVLKIHTVMWSIGGVCETHQMVSYVIYISRGSFLLR